MPIRRLFAFKTRDFRPVIAGRVKDYGERLRSDWCIAQVASPGGHTDVVNAFMEGAKNDQNVFDPEVGFRRGRNRDGRREHSMRKPIHLTPIRWKNPESWNEYMTF